MKPGRIITLTLAGISLGVTGCRRGSYHGPHGTDILAPGDLPQDLRQTLPAFSAEGPGALANPPHNAYEPHLGYFHRPCEAWFPYPYGHYDPRWGYYRCGRWYSSKDDYHDSRPGHLSRHWRPSGGVSPTDGTPVGAGEAQPSGAPLHAGVPTAQAEATRSNLTSRGGFGGTGRRSSSFSGT